MEEAADADGGRVGAVLQRAAPVRAAYEVAAGRSVRDGEGFAGALSGSGGEDVDPKRWGLHGRRGIMFGEVGGQMMSAADMVLALLGVKPRGRRAVAAGAST